MREPINSPIGPIIAAASTNGLAVEINLLAIDGYTVKFMKLKPARAPAPTATAEPESICTKKQNEFVCHGVKNSDERETTVQPTKAEKVDPKSSKDTLNGARV